MEITQKTANGCTLFFALADGSTTAIHVPFSDDASIENACHCAVFCLRENLLTEGVRERFAQLRQVDMRLQMVADLNRCTILNDSYSSDLLSLRMALEALALLPGFKHRSVILTDMRLRGKTPQETYTECAQLVNRFTPQKTVLVGKAIGAYHALFSGQVFAFESTEDFMAHFPVSLFQQEAILVKGIREYRPERIVELLGTKAPRKRCSK